MKRTLKNQLVFILGMLLFITSMVGFKYNKELNSKAIESIHQDPESKVYEKSKNNFSLKKDDEVKLINSAIKQDYNIFFSGHILEFDTLIIGKGMDRYLSSYIVLERDSVIFYRITHFKQRKAYRHHLKLKNKLSINIDRKVNSALVSIVNENDTFEITSDFVGMNNPFVSSMGTAIDVDKFEFNCSDYYSDVYVFGDSYVSCGSSERWPYYFYNSEYQFFCDGLPGGRSSDSYDFLNSALSIHKPKYIIWCLGMNDGGDTKEASPSWKKYTKKVMGLCSENNVTLILSTVPSVPTRDNSGKNKYVRASGYRYVDFDSAVSDGKGNWKEGMLFTDGVHPTALGAKKMAEKLLNDFPEIKSYMK